MIYHYLASNKAGKKIEGNFETDDIGRVLQYLASQELRPLTVTPIKTGSEADVRHFFGGINLSDNSSTHSIEHHQVSKPHMHCSSFLV
jgi:type II secretory pathway component PulF